MMFKIEFSRNAEKFLQKCDRVLQKRLISKIDLLESEPVLHDSKSLANESRIFRVRVGDYRILYRVDWDVKIVLIAKIDERSKVYD